MIGETFRKIRCCIALLLVLTSFAAQAATCSFQGQVCVDSTPCKQMSGVSVCLAGVPLPAGASVSIADTCWRYTSTYNCVKPNAINYCAAISQIPGCSQTNSTCAIQDTVFNTGCMQWTNTYQCGTGLTTPPNTLVLNTSYTIASSTMNNTACASYANNPTCALASHTCVDTTPSKVINGLTVTLAQAGGCWQYTDNYACIGAMQSNCAPLIAKGCTLTSSKPIQYGLGGVVTLTENIYKCPVPQAAPSTVMDCGNQQFCTGGNCFNTGHASNSDIAQAAAAMEITRQAATYKDPTTMQIFNGQSDQCTDTLGGLGNCCTSSVNGNGMSNSLLFGIIVSAGLSVAGQGVAYGSNYVYDALMNTATGQYIQSGISAMQTSMSAFQSSVSNFFGFSSAAATSTAAAGASTAAAGASTAAAGASTAAAGASTAASTGATAAANTTVPPPTGFTPSVGAFGFTVTYGGTAGAAGSLAAQQPLVGTATNLGSAGNFNFTFNPTMFYITVGIMVYQELTSCTQQEHILSMKKGQRLCRYATTYCSVSYPIIGCTQTTETYCCFNSRLARIINTEGGKQLGRAASDCSGFTTAQFALIDFSKVDLSEFTAEIMANVHPPNMPAIGSDNAATMAKKTANYYATGHQ